MVPVQPQARAVPMACAARLAAPRAEGAFPPRSLVAAATGAASRGADRGDERVQPADQHRLALDLGVAGPGAFLLMAVDPFLRRVDVDEGQDIGPGQQRRLPGEPG